MIEQHLQCANASLSARASCSSTARTWFLSTPGNHSTNSSIVAPLARFSNRAYTGTRVPVNAHAPLILPSLRSTAGQLLPVRHTVLLPASTPCRTSRIGQHRDRRCQPDRLRRQANPLSGKSSRRLTHIELARDDIRYQAAHGIRADEPDLPARNATYRYVSNLAPSHRSRGLRNVAVCSDLLGGKRHINPTEVLEVQILSVDE